MEEERCEEAEWKTDEEPQKNQPEEAAESSSTAETAPKKQKKKKKRKLVESDGAAGNNISRWCWELTGGTGFTGCFVHFQRRRR